MSLHYLRVIYFVLIAIAGDVFLNIVDADFTTLGMWRGNTWHLYCPVSNAQPFTSSLEACETCTAERNTIFGGTLECDGVRGIFNHDTLKTYYCTGSFDDSGLPGTHCFNSAGARTGSIAVTFSCPMIGPGGAQLLRRDANNELCVYLGDPPPTSTPPMEADKTAGSGSCPVGTGANTATGNTHHQDTDFSSPKTGSSLTRSKNNSLGDTNLALGAGWTANCFQKIAVDGNSIVVTEASGRSEAVTCAGIGACTVDPDSKISVEQTASGYVVNTADNKVEVYDSMGKLLSITDAAGQTMTMGHDPISGVLETVTDHFGGVISFTYNTDLMVNTMTDPDGNVYNYAYDTNDNLISVTYPDSSIKQYLYEDTNFPNHITGVIDENGNRSRTWSYDSEGRVLYAEKANGHGRVDLTYNTDGTTTVTDALGAVNTFTFVESHGVKRTTAISGGQCGSGCSQGQAQSYDANGFLASRTDFEGNVTNFVNNSRGLQTSRTEAVGTTEERTITTEWHAALRLPTKITEGIKETTLTYNSTGQVLTRTVTDTATSNSRTTTFTYDSNGLLTSVDGPRTDVTDTTTYTYDSSGNRLTMTNALSQTTNFTSYDNSGRLLSMTDPNGVVTSMTHDVRGRLKTRTVDGVTTTFDYDNVGNLTKITQPNGSYLEYTYDASSRLTDIEDNLGNKISYTLDALGNRTKEDVYDDLSVLQRTQSRTFDNLSQLIQTVGGENQITVLGYDGNGNQISVLDPLSRNSTSEFDSLNRLIKQTDAATNDTDYEYDDRDNLTKVTDPRGLETTYTYDGLDNQTQQVSPDTGTTTYTYDSAGNRLTQTDAKGIVATFAYDALNRATSISYPNSQYDITYAYDGGTHGIGRLTGMTYESGTTSYSYDARGNLISEARTIQSRTYTTSYQYDNADNLTQMIYPTGLVVDYTRNTVGQISSVSATDGTGTAQTIASSIIYKPFGPIASMNLGNGLTTTLTYDQDYRLTDKVTPTIYDVDFAYDAANNITSTTDNLTGVYGSGTSFDQSFQYDVLDRLTQWVSYPVNSNTSTYTWTYDANGNRTEGTDYTQLDFNNSSTSNRLDSATETQGGAPVDSWTYDANGNTTYAEYWDHDYTYGDHNRLVEIQDDGVIVASYQYNGKGERVVRTAYETHVYHFDQNGQLIAETKSNGVPLREYIYLDGQLIAMTEPEYEDWDYDGIPDIDDNCRYDVNPNQRDTNSDGYGNICDPDLDNDGDVDNDDLTIVQNAIGTSNADADIDGDGNVDWWDEGIVNGWIGYPPGPNAGVVDNYFWVHNDHLGTPQLMTADDQFIVWHQTYTPFGDKWVHPVGYVDIHVRMPGQFYDNVSQLNYNYFRDYNPLTGRFMQSDPIGIAGGINTYAYVSNNPVRRIDPFGLFQLDCDNQDCGKKQEIEKQVKKSCDMADAMITDPNLRECIKKRCDTGKLKCKNNCRPRLLGFNSAFIGIRSRTANICVNNFPAGSEAFGPVAIHEWAHSCRWNHGDGSGVPGDDGTQNSMTGE